MHSDFERYAIRKVVIGELKAEERKTLKMIGNHVGVGAFREADNVPRDVTIKVKYVNTPKAATSKPNGESDGLNDAAEAATTKTEPVY